jgi:prepilin-type N-terminal cleavage/methylation domain-containing protein/prepilin-type processing-associated H-X9-DG protein
MNEKKAFTLIELLVVISILVFLMALLLPALQRARKQARAVACQANLRQWGIMFHGEDLANSGSSLFGGDDWRSDDPLGITAVDMWEHRYGTKVHGLLLCPMAARPAARDRLVKSTGQLYGYGSTFEAWWYTWPGPPVGPYTLAGSYGRNVNVGYDQVGQVESSSAHYWRSAAVKEASSIPVFFDCPQALATSPDVKQGPPFFYYWNDLWLSIYNSTLFIDRHKGGVNYLFLDWSVRKVGLKEIFTLRWDKLYDTANRWTKAGGVTPVDWPAWMRGYKDY